jgi:hypothetical protein
MNVPHEYVEQTLAGYRYFARQGQKIFGDPTVLYEWLLEHGEEFQGARWRTHHGKGYRMGKVRECFQNAFLRTLYFDNLTYCEGYAFSGLLPVHHAWCVDENDVVVDPTWREKKNREPAANWEYFGVRLDVRRHVARWLQGGDAAFLFSHWTLDELTDLVITTEARSLR